MWYTYKPHIILEPSQKVMYGSGLVAISSQDPASGFHQMAVLRQILLMSETYGNHLQLTLYVYLYF